LGTSAKVPGMATSLVSCLPRRRVLAAHHCHIVYRVHEGSESILRLWSALDQRSGATPTSRP
jgi:hypothetical protein